MTKASQQLSKLQVKYVIVKKNLSDHLSAAQRPFVGIHPVVRGGGGGGDAPVPDPFPDKLGPSGAQHPDSAGALSLGTPPWCPLSSAGSVKMSAFGAYHLCTDNTLDISVVWRPCPP